MKKHQNDTLVELVAAAHRLHRRTRRAGRVVSFSMSMIGPALRTAAVISLARRLGPRRTGRLLAAVAGNKLARSRRR
ncbi:MAG: hypothetical protein ACJ76I_11170 [Gaiellaceae bacterium]